MGRAARWALVVGSVALIVAATLLPFFAIAPAQLPPRWCLACGGEWAADAISNVLLFVPLGVAFAGLGWRAASTLGIGALLSLAVEVAQSVGVPPGRSPAVADLLTNAAGALLGAQLAMHGPRAWRARGPRAARYAAVWGALSTGTLFATAAAEHRTGAAPPSVVALSPIAYSPGYGWYGGQPVSASFFAELEGVSGLTTAPWVVAHTGTGPIVATTNRPSEYWTVSIRTIGRDTARYGRSLLYLHTVGDTTPEVVVVQRDRAAELRVRRRALAWGLGFPTIALADVFPERDGADTIHLAAIAAPDHLALRSVQHHRVESAQVDLTPALGWVMLQSVVGVQDALAPVVQALWLAALALPLGWWGARVGRRVVVGASCAGLVVAGVASAMALQVAPLTARDWAVLLAAWGVGALAGRYAGPRHLSAPPG